MYAPRHAVFVGPGKLPAELREVLHRRIGAPQPDIPIQVPRLLALFDSAAEAERVAAQLQRLKLGAVVAGPEQPPSTDGWTVARTLERSDGRWRVTSVTGELLTIDPAEVTGITIVDWRPLDGAADRAMLVTLREGRPVFVRASVLDQVSAHSLPLEGMQRMSDFLERAGHEFPADLRVRTRRLAQADFQPDELTGDLLPLAVHVVDAVDTLPGQLPRPLPGPTSNSSQRTSSDRLAVATPAPGGVIAAWTLFGLSIPALGYALASLTFALAMSSVITGAVSLLVGAWATRRYMWARWLARANWGPRPPLPSWPIDPNEPGTEPRAAELLLDVATVGALATLASREGLAGTLGLAGLVPAAVASVASIAAVWDARQRR
jgi:hypothetical protein